MTQDYSELLNRLDNIVSGKTTNFTNKTNEQAATAIRALVEENGRLRSELQKTSDWINSSVEVPTPGATARMIAIRAALGETK